MGIYGIHHEATPTLNDIAAEGTLFNRAFCTAPLCSPARGSLFTGKYPHSNGLMGLAHLGWSYGEDERTLPAHLSAIGYQSVLLGLQHESTKPESLGFDDVVQVVGRQYCDDVAALTERYLLNRRASKPLFISIGFWETHRPYSPERYRFGASSEMMVPEFLPDNEHTRHDLAGCYGAITSADAATGRVVRALAHNGLLQNTWFIFTTDHGMAFPRAKSTLYDPGIEVAMVMRLPERLQSPRVVDDLVSHIDIVPTLLEAVGGEIPSDVQGISFLSRLGGSGTPQRTKIFAEKTWHDATHYDPMRGIRTGRFKFIKNYAAGPQLLLPGDIEASATREGMGDAHLAPRDREELYDLASDPWEQHNVAGGPEYASVRETMAADLAQWQVDTGDPLLDGDIPAPPVPPDAANDPHTM